MARAPERPALLIIDMISAFDFPEARALHADLVAAARGIQRLRAQCQVHGLPVIYANDNFAHWRTDFRELVHIAAGASPIGREVTTLLQPGPDDYFILKPKHSAFLATALPVLLAKLGVDTLYLTGMTADSCILATALDANAREYRVRVIREAVAGLPKRKREALGVIAASHAADVILLRSALRSLRPPGR